MHNRNVCLHSGQGRENSTLERHGLYNAVVQPQDSQKNYHAILDEQFEQQEPAEATHQDTRLRDHHSHCRQPFLRPAASLPKSCPSPIPKEACDLTDIVTGYLGLQLCLGHRSRHPWSWSPLWNRLATPPGSAQLLGTTVRSVRYCSVHSHQRSRPQFLGAGTPKCSALLGTVGQMAWYHPACRTCILAGCCVGAMKMLETARVCADVELDEMEKGSDQELAQGRSDAEFTRPFDSDDSDDSLA